MALPLKHIIFVGLNSRVAALNRKTGQLIWQWRASKPKSGGYVSLLLLDISQLIVSVNGYTYSLDPVTGAEQWFNELKGFGSSVTSLAALGASSPQDLLQAAAAADAAAAAAAAAGS